MFNSFIADVLKNRVGRRLLTNNSPNYLPMMDSFTNCYTSNGVMLGSLGICLWMNSSHVPRLNDSLFKMTIAVSLWICLLI